MTDKELKNSDWVPKKRTGEEVDWKEKKSELSKQAKAEALPLKEDEPGSSIKQTARKDTEEMVSRNGMFTNFYTLF